MISCVAAGFAQEMGSAWQKFDVNNNFDANEQPKPAPQLPQSPKGLRAPLLAAQTGTPANPFPICPYLVQRRHQHCRCCHSHAGWIAGHLGVSHGAKRDANQ